MFFLGLGAGKQRQNDRTTRRHGPVSLATDVAWSDGLSQEWGKGIMEDEMRKLEWLECVIKRKVIE
jgi:hypothetical protein